MITHHTELGLSLFPYTATSASSGDVNPVPGMDTGREDRAKDAAVNSLPVCQFLTGNYAAMIDSFEDVLQSSLKMKEVHSLLTHIILL